MDDYHRLVVAQFFEALPNLSQESCHQYVLNHVVPTLLPNSTGKVEIQPSPSQGSMSYTAILHTHFANADHRIVVQFRSDKQDLFGINEASRIHGPIAPLVTYQGMYEGLIVYTSPFAEGIPYINVLMSSEDYELPLQKRMVTIMDLADLVTRGAKVKTTTFDATMSHLHCTLEDIHDLVRCYNFRHAILERNILTCITRLLPGLDNIATLPVALSHQDLSPFNYLVDESTGQVQAVLDWDGALYLPVGSNFHFMDSLFGLMTTSGWQDAEDRQELETAFYDRALASLAAQGFVGITREQLESQKAVGMLEYGVKRLLKFQDERSEHYLDGYLRGLSFMNGCMFP